jgi:hypothetical protein
MGTEQYNDLVLYRRGAGLLLNPYSPVFGSNDGIANPLSFSLFRWGLNYDQNKFPIISNENGAFYPDASNDYLKKIKTNGTEYGFNRFPFIYFSIKNRGLIKRPSDTYTIKQTGYKASGFGYTNGGHNIYYSGVFAFTKRFGKGEYQGDYNPFTPYNPSGTTNDSVTISALNSNPQFYNFRPVTTAEGYQAVGTLPASTQYPNGRTLFAKAEGTVTWDPIYGFVCNYNTNPIYIYVNNYNPSRNGYVKYGTLPFDESQFVLLTDNSDAYHRPVWWKEYGTEFTSDTIPYNNVIENTYYNFPEIILRDNNDTTQPEYDISSNPLMAGLFTNFNNPDLPCYLEKLGVYTALRTPNNETPFVMRNQIMKFDFKANMIDGCPDACWHSNKVVKIKLKYQKGTVSIYKNSGNIVNTGYPEVEVSLKINWNDYEEEIVDNIDIFFDQGENGQDYGILWSKEIECPAGQAKRLVDVCVLEIRDKT